MYAKNLNQDLRLRLTEKDMDFLRELSYQRRVSISEVIRSIIGNYRRSCIALEAITNAFNSADVEEVAGHGVTKTVVDDQL